MDGNKYPITLEEFKEWMRIPECDDTKDSVLQQSLDAACRRAENFTGRDFNADYPADNFPPDLKTATLQVAGYYFQNPIEVGRTIPTISESIFVTYRKQIDYEQI